MNFWQQWFSRKKKWEQDLNEELRFHIEQQTAANIAAGMPREEARRQTMLQLGAVEGVKEYCREERRSFWLESAWADVRYAARMLRRSPGFTIVAVLTLALGIGANTAIFSVVDFALLRPLPYSSPGRLVYISEFWPRATPVQTVPSPDFANWSDHDQLFDGLAAYGGGAEVNLTSDAGPERVQGVVITSNFFSLLGVRLLRGREFLSEEDSPGGRHVTLISQEVWSERFGSDPSLIGRSIKLDGIPYVVVGIVPAGFRFPDDQFKARFFLPMGVARAANWTSPQYFRLLRPLARLKRGVTVAQAQAELDTLVARTATQEPPQFSRMRTEMEVHVTPLKERLAAPARPILLMLFSFAGFLLLMCCVNVASLELARGAARQRELAVRAALGASRFRLYRQLLMECLALVTLAIPVALLVGFTALNGLRVFAPPQIPHLESMHLDPAMLLFTIIVAIVTGIVFGLPPAIFASRTVPNEALKRCDHSGPGRGHRRVQSVLTVAQIAIAALLLVGSGLLGRSLVHLILVNSGFDPHHLLTVRLSLSGDDYSKSQQQTAFFEELVERLKVLPGIQSVGAGSGLPVIGSASLRGTNVEDRPQLPVGLRPDVSTDVVSAQYLGTLHIPLLMGREFQARDSLGAPQVAIVNQAFVHQFFLDRNPVGKHVKAGAETDPWREIVGVVGNVRQLGPDHPESPEIYIPYLQEPTSDMFLVLRTAGDPAVPLAQVRAAVRELDSSQPVYDAATMEERLWLSIAPQRFSALLVGAFAVLAMILGAIGIYGVLAFSMARRTREIGIRVALGAQRLDLLRTVISEGLQPAMAGTAIGIAAAVGLTRYIASQLHGIKPTDPLTFAVVAILLLLVALLACYIPARRAMRVDPMVALRHE